MTKIFRYFRSLSDDTVKNVLFAVGLILAAGELYKQLFLYFVINHGNYDWWFFPFQLCSIPMYLCVIQFFIKSRKARRVIGTFLRDYCIMAGLAAIIVHEGFSGIHWSLTLHGYLWHTIMILTGFFCDLTGLADDSGAGYVRTLPLFWGCAAIATVINIAAPRHGEADMFYISPYHVSVQPVVHELGLAIGIIPSDILYLCSICLGAAIIHFAFAALNRHACRTLTS